MTAPRKPGAPGRLLDRWQTGRAPFRDELASRRGLPAAIVMDNGPEFTGRALFAWSARTGVRQLRFIQPGKPIQTASVASFIVYVSFISRSA